MRYRVLTPLKFEIQYLSEGGSEQIEISKLYQGQIDPNINVENCIRKWTRKGCPQQCQVRDCFGSIPRAQYPQETGMWCPYIFCVTFSYIDKTPEITAALRSIEKFLFSVLWGGLLPVYVHNTIIQFGKDEQETPKSSFVATRLSKVMMLKMVLRSCATSCSRKNQRKNCE